jgi:ABC-type phosphate/phosphonate transport system substrate-binding protein
VLKLTVTAGVISLASLFVFANPAAADPTDPGAAMIAASLQKAAYRPPVAARAQPPAHRLAAGAAADTLVFSAPPQETPEEGTRIYEPVAKFLAKVTGKPVVYRHPDNWLTYQTEMIKGSYDIVFDDPHFISWRLQNLRHNVLARLGDDHTFAVIVRKNDTQTTNLKQLIGRGICAIDPPNLGTLEVLTHYENPLRIPAIMTATSWSDVYESVALGKRCAAGILPVANLRQHDPAGLTTRVLFKTRPLPNEGFSAGPRVSPQDQARIATALLSAEAAPATEALRSFFGSQKGFVPASREEFAGLDGYLKDIRAYAH